MPKSLWIKITLGALIGNTVGILLVNKGLGHPQSASDLFLSYYAAFTLVIGVRLGYWFAKAAQ